MLGNFAVFCHLLIFFEKNQDVSSDQIKMFCRAWSGPNSYTKIISWQQKLCHIQAKSYHLCYPALIRWLLIWYFIWVFSVFQCTHLRITVYKGLMMIEFLYASFKNKNSVLFWIYILPFWILNALHSSPIFIHFPSRIPVISVFSPGRWKWKKLILSMNVDQKFYKQSFQLPFVAQLATKWQFLAIFDPGVSIVKSFFDCRLSGVMFLQKKWKKVCILITDQKHFSVQDICRFWLIGPSQDQETWTPSSDHTSAVW